MFTAEETYIKFLVKINKNDSQFRISCDRGRFVLLVNENKHKWALETIEKDKGSVLIEHVQDIVKDIELLNPVETKEYSEFTFGNGYYETIGGVCLAEQGECKSTLRLREVKNQDKQLLYFDSSNQPSFEYEWSYYTVQNNKLRVYKKDFKVISATIEYYELIPEFDIEGYIKADGQASTNIPFTLSDDTVDAILDVTAKDFMRIYQNQVGFALQKEQTDKN